MSFYGDLRISANLTSKGVDDAITAARLLILRGNHGRFVFASRAYNAVDLRRLPLGDLLDHRLRGPLLDRNRSKNTLDRVCDVETLLWRMLQSANRKDARAIVAESLRLDPARDAQLIVDIACRDRALARHLIRGRLGTAIRHVDAHSPENRKEGELALAARLLVYFSCFSVQLVAAQAWLIEHPPWHPGQQKGAYRLAGLSRDLRDVADTVAQIADYAAGKRNRYPSRRLVTDLKALAERWREVLGRSDAELRGELPPIYSGIILAVRAARKWAAKALEQARQNDVTLHKVLFGVTAAQAVVFSATRLVQLRDAAASLVDEARRGEPLAFPARRDAIPGRDDDDVVALIYILRVMQLDDLS